jgi:hypothetical protein
MRFRIGWLIYGLLLLPQVGEVHHSPSMFDGSSELMLTGTVREFQWSNPHSYIQLVVESDDGSEQEWSIEMGANAYLYNLGWRPSTLKPGDELIVTILPLRNGEFGGLLMNITTVEGIPVGGRP